MAMSALYGGAKRSLALVQTKLVFHQCLGSNSRHIRGVTKYELRDPLIKGLKVYWLNEWKHPVASIVMSETMML
jgi:hypothetical protein